MRRENQQLDKWHLQTGENTDHENASVVEPSHVSDGGQEGLETDSPSLNYSRAKSTLDGVVRRMKELRSES